MFADAFVQGCPATVAFSVTSQSYILVFGVLSPTSDLLAPAIATFRQSCDDLPYDFPSFVLFREVLFWLMSSRGTPLPFVPPGWPLGVKSSCVSPYVIQYAAAAALLSSLSLAPHTSASYVKPVQRCARELGVSHAVARQPSWCHRVSSLRGSTSTEVFLYMM